LQIYFADGVAPGLPALGGGQRLAVENDLHGFLHNRRSASVDAYWTLVERPPRGLRSSAPWRTHENGGPRVVVSNVRRPVRRLSVSFRTREKQERARAAKFAGAPPAARMRTFFVTIFALPSKCNALSRKRPPDRSEIV
jgi:hypothetical protein